jgi:hypothetical protein
MSKEAAAAQGLDQPNIRWEGMVSSNELIRRLRAEADFLFAPMSFAERDRYNMEISFPSKLTDYTAMGLPLFIYGPPYASAVRWAEENAGSAVVLTSENDEDMHAALKRLCHDSPWRTELAQGAVSAGARWLSHEAGQRVFESALLAASLGRQSI